MLSGDLTKKITVVKDMVTEGTDNYVDLQRLGNKT